MKFFNKISQEIRTKWSSRLLLGLVSLVILNIILVNFSLKNQYDTLKQKSLQDSYAKFTSLLEKPFKHLKVENGNFTIANHTSRNAFLYHYENDIQTWIDSVSIQNDTLFIKVKSERQSYPMPDFYIISPYFESISAKNGEFNISKMSQRALNINLTDRSILDIKSTVDDLDNLNVQISDKSRFYISKSEHDTLNLNIQNLNVNLQNESSLDAKYANIKNFTLTASDKNEIILNTETLNALMKKH